MRDAADLRLRVNAVDYADITTATLTRGIEQVADDLSLDVTEKWLTSNLEFPLRSGDACEFVVDGDVVLTGLITGIPLGYSAEDHSVTIACKSNASRLVTSSYTGRPRTWKDATLEQIVRDVVAPYEIDVDISTDLGDSFNKFGAGIGETSWSVIQRAAQARGVWVVSRADGGIDIVETGAERYLTALVGKGGPTTPNILAASREDQFEDRHNEVIVVGQAGQRANWDDEQLKGAAVASDPGVAGHHPLIIYEGSESSLSKLQDRADWEVRRRAGGSMPLSFTVLGWAESDPGEPLWDPNRIVRVEDPVLRASGDYLISQVVTTFGEGTTAQLTCVAPETFQRDAPLPMPRPALQPRNNRGRWSPWA